MSGGCGYPAGLHGGGGPLLALYRHPAPSSLPPAGRRCPIITSWHPGQPLLHISVSAGLLFVPESPIWLLGHRGEEEAARALRWLRSGEGRTLSYVKALTFGWTFVSSSNISCVKVQGGCERRAGDSAAVSGEAESWHHADRGAEEPLQARDQD